jgi:CHASE2 domain-containing sensor protein
VLVQAVRTRRPAVIVTSALGLFAIAVAAATGASFTSTGEAADSMGMAVMTGVALLCYAANLYLLPRPASPAQASPAQASTAQAGTVRGYPAGGGTTGAGKSRL